MTRAGRRNKHNSVKVSDMGCDFDSKAEWRYALWLDNEFDERRIRAWDHHTSKIPLHVNGKLICTMHPDFTVWCKNGEVEYHEVKGLATAKWRLERKLLSALHPSVAYVVIDAQKPGNVETGEPPRLFDDRPRRSRTRARRKK